MPAKHPSEDQDSSPEAERAPVTVTVARKVAAGREADFEAWVNGVLDTASKFPGFLGAGVLRPPASSQQWHVVYRFEDAATQQAWEHSAERAAWLAKAGDFADETGVKRVSGLETWFELPGRTAPAPPKWKMALVTFCAIYPLALAISVFLSPKVTGWPLLARAVVFPAILVPTMTWVAMPWLTRLLQGWLYP